MITKGKKENKNIPPKRRHHMNLVANFCLLSPSCTRPRAEQSPFMPSFNIPQHPGTHFTEEGTGSETFTDVMEATQTE